MNRIEIIGQLEDLLYNFRNFVSVETTDADGIALEFAINELRKETLDKKQNIDDIDENVDEFLASKKKKANFDFEMINLKKIQNDC